MQASLSVGSVRNGRDHGAAPDGADWTCAKRDGAVVPFDATKIERALARCFESIGEPAAGAEHVPGLVRGVLNTLRATSPGSTSVEDVQRLAIQQLWAHGLFAAAEHYQNYRETRRRARESRPIPPAVAAAVAEDATHFPTPLQYYQFVSKFARWREQDGRRETWREACDRVMAWFRTLPRVVLSEGEWATLGESLYNLETSCAMRVIQMAGPALERCAIGAYNCAYLPLEDWQSFGELLYVLMAGSGCGFSVEDEYVSRLPRIARQEVPAVVHEYAVEDDTIGWCDSVVFQLDRMARGEDVAFQYHLIRKRNTRLKTKGGRASGPEPLMNIHRFIRALFLARQGGVLSDIDCHDIACWIGKGVQVGGVRRASSISLSDLKSAAMRACKSGNWYETNSQRTMANNSAVYATRPSPSEFVAEFLALIESRSGERGIFNREAINRTIPARRKPHKRFGMNPCAEIVIRPYGLCNLSIVVARPWDTPESLTRKVTIAAYWGCMQKTATHFQYVRPEWHQNAEEEALLGVDITGHADCPILRYGAPGRAALLDRLRAVVAEVDTRLSARFGVNRSAADTCVKPSGDSAVFFDCGSGVSPRFAERQIRWVREPVDSPVAQLLMAEGVPSAEAPEDKALRVFGFPKAAPAGSTIRNDMTAIDQLENWLEWKEHWAEHSVACTIYVEEAEWPRVLAWVYDHFDRISGLSFLPKDNGAYAFAPNEELTAEQYESLVAAFPTIRWEKLCHFEASDQTQSARTFACVGGGCD